MGVIAYSKFCLSTRLTYDNTDLSLVECGFLSHLSLGSEQWG